MRKSYYIQGCFARPPTGGRARVRPVGKIKKVFEVVRNEYYGQVDNLKNSSGFLAPTRDIHILSPGRLCNGIFNPLSCISMERRLVTLSANSVVYAMVHDYGALCAAERVVGRLQAHTVPLVD